MRPSGLPWPFRWHLSRPSNDSLEPLWHHLLSLIFESHIFLRVWLILWNEWKASLKISSLIHRIDLLFLVKLSIYLVRHATPMFFKAMFLRRILFSLTVCKYEWRVWYWKISYPIRKHMFDVLRHTAYNVYVFSWIEFILHEMNPTWRESKLQRISQNRNFLGKHFMRQFSCFYRLSFQPYNTFRIALIGFSPLNF